ncbi:MAG: hypothetical protein ACK5WB_00040 [Phycisphaerales bacterium]|jgi:hypothetical protein|nr:hypothetical protein [Phycisphaeraceae bacterium]
MTTNPAPEIRLATAREFGHMIIYVLAAPPLFALVALAMWASGRQLDPFIAGGVYMVTQMLAFAPAVLWYFCRGCRLRTLYLVPLLLALVTLGVTALFGRSGSIGPVPPILIWLYVSIALATGFPWLGRGKSHRLP